mgnify:CR=1 FL=1
MDAQTQPALDLAGMYETIDLKYYLQVMRKWRTVIAAMTAITVLTTGALSFFVLPPVYETKSTLLVTRASDQRATASQEKGLEAVVNTLSRIPELTVKTYVGQLTSPGMMKRVIDQLKLDQELYTPESLGRMVDVKAVKDTNLIEVKVTNTDPELAARIANTLGQEFLAFISETNQEQMTKSVSFLEKQRAEVQAKLKEATDKFKEFDAQPRGVDFLEKELAGKSADLGKYRSELLQAEVELQLSLAGKARLEQSLASTPPTIQVKESSSGGEAGGPSTVVKEEVNPAYVSLTQMLDQKNLAIAEGQAQRDGLAATIAALEGELENLQAELTEKRVERDRLQKEISLLEQTYLLLSQKITETQIARSMDLGQTTVQVVSPALKPVRPVKPRKMLNMAVALVVGFMVAVGVAFLLEHLDNTVKTPEDVERHLGLPVLGSIPRFRGADLRP